MPIQDLNGSCSFAHSPGVIAAIAIAVATAVDVAVVIDIAVAIAITVAIANIAINIVDIAVLRNF